jgi:tetratricopeptide (TPR) repeat protein
MAASALRFRRLQHAPVQDSQPRPGKSDSASRLAEPDSRPRGEQRGQRLRRSKPGRRLRRSKPVLRLRRGNRGSRAKRPKPRWPKVVLWSAGLVVGVAALVALAQLHGNPPPDAKQGFPSPALETLAKPGVAALAAFTALTLIAWCVRHLRFEFLAWWPGRIVVRNFVANGDVSAAEVERLTTGFRDRLGMSHLQSPASVPAPAEQGDFLDVLAQGGMSSGNLMGTLLSLLRAAFPAHAYEVSGALVTRAGPKPYGVTVHVVRSPGKGAGGHTVWDTSWDAAVRHAADHATAAILPRTRVCRSPWVGWRRYYMPPKLLQHYEHAAQCEHERRYDEALASYYEALEFDPMNHGLRLQVGFLQEKLGLYLDALDTYENILKVAESSSGYDVLRRSYRRSARRDHDRTLRVARYRHAVLLGGAGLPHQWRKLGSGDRTTRRDAERERLRERLTPSLTELFERASTWSEVEQHAVKAYEAAGRKPPPREHCESALERREPGDRSPDRLPELFLLGSLDRLHALHDELPPSRPWRRPPVTQAAVRVSLLVVRERLRLLLGQARCAPQSGWVPYIEKLEEDIGEIEPASGFDRWQEHYNVACIWSLPLLTKCSETDREDVKRLAAEAVDRLECATERADAEFLVSRRDWLLSEDPDLEGLRIQPSFKSFEAAYFPSASSAPQRPREVQRWEVSRYTLDLLRAAAQRRADGWESRARALEPVTGRRVLLRWCEDERSARQLMHEVALHHRDWRTRFELVKRTREWSAENGFEPIEVAFPGFSAESGLGEDREEVQATNTNTIADQDARLDLVVDRLEAAGRCAVKARDQARTRVFRMLDEIGARRNGAAQRGLPERGLPRAQVARLCVLHANVWRQLAELVTPSAKRHSAAARLAEALAETAAACRGIQEQPSAGAPADQAEVHANGSGPGQGQAVPSG